MGHDFPLVWLIAAFVAYTALLFLISYLTSRNAGKNSFFGNRRITEISIDIMKSAKKKHQRLLMLVNYSLNALAISLFP